jgi:hypothetical protein
MGKKPFYLKTKGELFGIDERFSTYNRPVFIEDLDDGVKAEARNNNTIALDKDLPEEQKEEAVVHEDEHLKNMSKTPDQPGFHWYDDNKVYYKEDTKSPIKEYPIEDMMDGGRDKPWEKIAYHASDKFKQSKHA